jgi:transposase, IS5 family
LRTKTLQQGYLDFSKESTLKVVKEYRSKYNKISDLLDANPEVLSLAHEDFIKILSDSDSGRDGGYTSENLLRSLVVMFIECESYRNTVIRVSNSDFLCNFVKLGVKQMMDYTFLCKAYNALTPETWKTMNNVLSGYAKDEDKITSEKIRVDTTVYETNIHHPTDSTLLWDSFRTLSRLMKSVHEELRTVGLDHRFHVKKVKKLSNYISRNANSKNKRKQRKVKRTYRTLMERVSWIVEIACIAAYRLDSMDVKAMAVSFELSHYIPIINKVLEQTSQRILHGVILPSSEKVYSIFEDHTELLKRGKAGKPIEFGHKVLLAETVEKFIIHYDAFPKQQADKDLLDETLQGHREVFEKEPDVLAADKGFYESTQQLIALRKKIATVSICKKGRRNSEEVLCESSEEFKAGQRFRAGVEGTISVLKRAFKLNRCFFKGFKNYATSLGCAVFCHNLVVLTRL